MNDYLKRRLFVSTDESVLLYGCEAWALTVKDEKPLGGVYTRMLRAALNVSWEDIDWNVDLYGYLPVVRHYQAKAHEACCSLRETPRANCQ